MKKIFESKMKKKTVWYFQLNFCFDRIHCTHSFLLVCVEVNFFEFVKRKCIAKKKKLPQSPKWNEKLSVGIIVIICPSLFVGNCTLAKELPHHFIEILQFIVLTECMTTFSYYWFYSAKDSLYFRFPSLFHFNSNSNTNIIKNILNF